MKYVGIGLLFLVGLFLAYVLLLVVSAYLVNGKKEYGKNSKYYRFLLESSTAVGLCILRVKIHLTGLDKVPKGARFLLVSNHRSNFDPIVTWRAFHGYDIAFVSKPANFKVPVWGRLIRRCGFLSIDRASPRESMKVFNRAAEMIKSGNVSFGIYPEGTRSKDCKLLPFHDGIFMVAQKAESPIVVLAVRGTEQIHKRYIRHRTHVYLDVLDVIPPEKHTSMRTGEIGAEIKDMYVNFLGSDIK
ncbi:MAG: 1-acyl-sn-glycerol-3-phosphate acyltransferase [Clostridia bacterium]|nr:1-acyl-sn-glycerol-3-phosphate acyltransferase [Clostridia bacterium]